MNGEKTSVVLSDGFTIPSDITLGDDNELEQIRMYRSDGAAVTNIIIVFTEEDLKPGHKRRSFNPDMVHQIFDNEGTIYGYRNLHIDIYYLANSAHCFVDIRYTEIINDDMLIPDPDDIILKLSLWLPEGYSTNKNMFLDRLKNENHNQMFGRVIDTVFLYNEKDKTTYEYIITLCSIDEPGFTEFHYRFQCMIVWFIDAASQIDADDPNWMFLYVYEKRTLDTSSTAGLYPVGFATVYKFFHFPDKIRARISQFFIIPSCQGMGLGTHLLKSTYKVITDLPNVVDIAVEDPCPTFTRIRDILDCQLLMELDCFKVPQINKGFSDTMYLEANKHYKINKKQCQRVYEILRFSYIKCDRFSPDYAVLYKEISHRLKIPYLKEQRCLKKIKCNPDQLSKFSHLISLESVQKDIACHMSEITTVAQYFLAKINK